MAVTATFVQHEPAGDPMAQQRQDAYLHHVAAAGHHPHLVALLATARPPADPADQFTTLVTSILTGLLATTAHTAMPGSAMRPHGTH